jgi:hypothetical protein
MTCNDTELIKHMIVYNEHRHWVNHVLVVLPQLITLQVTQDMQLYRIYQQIIRVC